MDIILDENIPVAIIPWLKNKGHNIILVAKKSSDNNVAAICKKHKAVLLTQDRHFANILLFNPKDFFGIIRIKIHPAYIEDIIISLEKLLTKLSKQELDKKLIILEKNGFFRIKE